MLDVCGGVLVDASERPALVSFMLGGVAWYAP